MVLTRAQNQPGPDGVLGDDPATPADESADDVQNANNTDSPWVDQSQTYTSHASHQVFLREYVNNAGGTAGRDRAPAGWPARQPAPPAWPPGRRSRSRPRRCSGCSSPTRTSHIPMLAADPYGNFIPGPARGLPQYVTATGLVEGDTAAPGAGPGERACTSTRRS